MNMQEKLLHDNYCFQKSESNNEWVAYLCYNEVNPGKLFAYPIRKVWNQKT